LARSPVHQAPIAIAASLGVAIISIALATREGGFAELRVPRTVVLWIPIVLGYWVIVGMRASFVLPAELKAAWAFRVHSVLPPFDGAQGAPPFDEAQGAPRARRGASGSLG